MTGDDIFAPRIEELGVVLDNVKTIEREVLGDARKMQDDFAWPTLLLLLGLYGAYGLALYGAISGSIPLWITFAVNALVAYAAYTPLHEAVHDNVAKGKWRWVTHIVGTLSSWLFMHNYSLQRKTHQSHHANLNDPKKDADHWVAGSNPLDVLMRCTTLAFAHYVIGARISDKRTLTKAFFENLVPVVWLTAIWVTFGWEIAVWGILLPALAGVTLLGLFFDYLAHKPYQTTVLQRFENTRAYIFHGPLRWIGPIVWSGQNYHLLHHLYPWVPFYLYGQVFRRAEILLEQKNSPVIHLGTKKVS